MNLMNLGRVVSIIDESMREKSNGAVQRTLGKLGSITDIYVVGGIVRDAILETFYINDIDITSVLLPQNVCDILRPLDGVEVIPTGEKYGTVTIVVSNRILSNEKVSIEHTTFRADGTYSDGRRPDNVVFGNNIYQDLARRDFTMNAMALRWRSSIESKDFIDPFNGRQDIEDGVIRTVGNPDERFQEDALRMMRAVRFASKFCFTIEPKTLQAIKDNAHLIHNVSVERISSELMKILMCDSPAVGLGILMEVGLMQYIIPELVPLMGFKQSNKHHIHDVWDHTLYAVHETNFRPNLRMAALLHDIGKQECFTMDNEGQGHFYGHAEISAMMAHKILLRLKFPTEFIIDTLNVIAHHMLELSPNDKDARLRKLLNKHGRDALIDLIDFNMADKLASGTSPEGLADAHEFIKERVLHISQTQPVHMSNLTINGDDIMEYLRIPAGPKVGHMLGCLMEDVLAEPSLNNREDLLVRVTYHARKEAR